MPTFILRNLLRFMVLLALQNIADGFSTGIFWVRTVIFMGWAFLCIGFGKLDERRLTLCNIWLHRVAVCVSAGGLVGAPRWLAGPLAGF